MFHYFLQALKKSFTFKGRARRKEFWSMILAAAIFGFLLGLILGISDASENTFNICMAAFQLLLFIPSLSLTARRLHDIGKSGWFMLSPLGALFLTILVIYLLNDLSLWYLYFAPLFLFYLFYYYLILIKKGDIGDNQYGPDPKTED
jgi:uncharacterized membrane protein YhaH (DUF805 family)